MKRGLNINISFTNRVLYTFISVIILLIVGVGVFAFGTPNPATFGHSAGELNLSAGVNGNAVFNNGVTVVGIIESTTGGIMFPDGTIQTTAIGLGGLWTPSGNNVYRNSGNVGIGTSSPSQRLEVVGSINANSINVNNITIGGVTFGVKYSEDVYGVLLPAFPKPETIDSCDGDTLNGYVCLVDEERTCIDRVDNITAGNRYYRQVECYNDVALVII